LLCGHIALIRRLHHNFDVDEALTADVGFDPLSDFVQVVLFKHPQAGLGHRFGDLRSLGLRGTDRHSHARFDFVCGNFGHQDHAHMSAGGIA
jgi:hypothetical protein